VVNDTSTFVAYCINDGSPELTLKSATPSTTAFSATISDRQVGSGDSVALRVHFHPQSIGMHSGRLLIATNSIRTPDTIIVNGYARSLTFVNPHEAVPTETIILQNYPNPFNPSTTIHYGLSNRLHVTLTVYNTMGQKVAQLVNGDQEAGYHKVRFDGSGLSSGVYFYRFQAGDFSQTRKLLLLR
jgi:hypothetical protein